MPPQPDTVDLGSTIGACPEALSTGFVDTASDAAHTECT